MINTDYFKNKKIAVAGLARSGLSCANLLYGLGARVRVTDNQDSDSTRQNALRLKSKEIKVELGKHTRDFLSGIDFLVVSPGLDNTSLPVVWCQEQGIPVISEIEVAGILCPATIIAVTGSNGKTTVTTLIGRMLEAKGERVFVCGNIGNPFCREVDKMKQGDFVSLEVSSFQLERIRTFKPKVAVILNFSPNHLDRHKDMQEYLDAKKRIFMNQDEDDYLVLNSLDSSVKELAKEAKSRIVFFCGSNGLNPNFAAVLSVGSILGVDKEISSKVFDDFKGLEHRMEFVAEINKIKFINDSKATTADSAIWALSNISSPVILIAGGRHKGIDYGVISGIAKDKVRWLILVGEAKVKIRQALNGIVSIDEAGSMEEAVRKAFLKARTGDSVLLSPMCSSFDMFTDYEERGRAFKKAVLDLQKGARSV